MFVPVFFVFCLITTSGHIVTTYKHIEMDKSTTFNWILHPSGTLQVVKHLHPKFLPPCFNGGGGVGCTTCNSVGALP